MTSHQECVRPVKERVGSSARNGDGEGGTNDVHATSIFGSRLGRQDGFGWSPVGHAVLDVPLGEGHRIRVRISASLKRCRFGHVWSSKDKPGSKEYFLGELSLRCSDVLLSLPKRQYGATQCPAHRRR